MPVTKTLYMTSDVNLINNVCCAILSETNSTSAVAEASDYAIYVDVILVSPSGEVTTLGSAGLTGFENTVEENSVTITPTSRSVGAGYAFGIKLRLLYSDSNEYSVYFLESPSSRERYIEGDVVVTYYSVLGDNGAYYVYFGNSTYPSKVQVTFDVSQEIKGSIKEHIADQYSYEHYVKRKIDSSLSEVLADWYSKGLYKYHRLAMSAAEVIADRYSYEHYVYHDVEVVSSAVIHDAYDAVLCSYHLLDVSMIETVEGSGFAELLSATSLVASHSVLLKDKYTVFKGRLFGCRALLAMRKRA